MVKIVLSTWELACRFVKIVLSTWELFVFRLVQLYMSYDFGPSTSHALVGKTRFCVFVGRAIRISNLSVTFELIYIPILYIVLFHIFGCFASGRFVGFCLLFFFV